MKFPEMKYERPIYESILSNEKEIQSNFSKAKDFESADNAFCAWDRFTAHIDTMINLAYTRNSINTADNFYEKEVEYIDKNTPLFAELEQSFKKLLVKSKFRPQFEQKYGSLLFKNFEMELMSFSPEIIPEMQG